MFKKTLYIKFDTIKRDFSLKKALIMKLSYSSQ